MNYYNDNDPKICAWLRELISAGLIPLGDVDDRSITDVQPADLRGYTQCHFFAGIGGWALALHLSGWPSTRPVWTGSCPCQPFSCAGKGLGQADARHLWPAFFRLIRECRPVTVFGEQVAGAIAKGWLDGVCADLEGENYAVGQAVLGAHSVKAPHVRQRLWWFAHSAIDGREGIQQCATSQVQKNWAPETLDAWHGTGNPFEQWEKLMAGTEFCRMADGISSCLDVRPALRAYGNAICPQTAALFIKAAMQSIDSCH